LVFFLVFRRRQGRGKEKERKESSEGKENGSNSPRGMTFPSLARLIFARVSSEKVRPGLAPRVSILRGGSGVGGEGERGRGRRSSPSKEEEEEASPSSAFADAIAGSCGAELRQFDTGRVGTRADSIRPALADRIWGHQGLIGSEEASEGEFFQPGKLRDEKSAPFSTSLARFLHSIFFFSSSNSFARWSQCSCRALCGQQQRRRCGLDK